MYPRPSDRKFGAKGNGADDTKPLQAWLDYLARNSVPGCIDRWYTTRGSLMMYPGMTLYGTHKDGSGFCHATPLARPLVSVPAGCRLFDVGFQGTPELREIKTAVLVAAADGADILFSGCGFSFCRTLVTAAATQRLKFSGCEFSHWGDSDILPELGTPYGEAALREGRPFKGSGLYDGGYALLAGNGSWPNDDLEVTRCHYHDGTWTAIDVLAPNESRASILDTVIERVWECGIYLGMRATIARCTIIDVSMRDVSGYPIEGGGVGTDITGNTFGNCDFAALLLANPVDFNLVSNTIFNTFRAAPADADPTPWAAPVMVRNIPASADKVSTGFTMADNLIDGRSGKATYCCALFDQGGGPYNDCTIGPNRMPGKWKAPFGGLVYCDAPGRNFHINH